jgi:hypothetical protein
MNQQIFKQHIYDLQDQIGEIYCRIREARGILDVLDERWGYNDPPLDVQYAYLGVKSVLKLGEDQIDKLESDLCTLRDNFKPLLPEYEDEFYDDEDDDDDAPEWDVATQVAESIQDLEREGVSVKVSDEDPPTKAVG